MMGIFKSKNYIKAYNLWKRAEKRCLKDRFLIFVGIKECSGIDNLKRLFDIFDDVYNLDYNYVSIGELIEIVLEMSDICMDILEGDLQNEF